MRHALYVCVVRCYPAPVPEWERYIYDNGKGRRTLRVSLTSFLIPLFAFHRFLSFCIPHAYVSSIFLHGSPLTTRSAAGGSTLDTAMYGYVPSKGLGLAFVIIYALTAGKPRGFLCYFLTSFSDRFSYNSLSCTHIPEHARPRLVAATHSHHSSPWGDRRLGSTAAVRL